ncbi:MAG TPA: serine/threonine-protein kinase [Polyangiaceae bacterium]|nr:serine/threonine-protein kinase [Polyangiaceae bacterium]
MAQCVRPDAEYPLGLVIDQQFRIDACLGQGSMARVYRAHQLQVGRDVALKIMRRELLGQPEVIARFREEAGLVARLSHPHVVVVYGVGQMPPRGPLPGDSGSTTADAREVFGTNSAVGEPYVVLELLQGRSLAQALDDAGGVLPLTRTLHVILALADAVGEAHARGIVHRDVKPDNVMLVERGSDHDFVKLLDFGLAKLLTEEREIRTRAGAILGTPHYVSPEGAQGQPVTPAADCYSLAALLFRCLAGRLPFEAPSAVTVLAQKASQPAPDLRSFPRAATVPSSIADLIMQNLARKPEQRAPNARAFGQGLVEAARLAGIEERDFGLSQTLVGARAIQLQSLTQSQESSPSSAASARSSPSSVTISKSIERAASTSESSASNQLSTASSQAQSPDSRAPVPNRSALWLVLACFIVGVLAAAAWGAWGLDPSKSAPPDAPPPTRAGSSR